MVGLAVEAALVAEEDLVVGLRARAPGDVEGVADRGALDGLDRAQRAGQAAVEAALPARVRAQPGRGAEGDDLEDAAERLVRLALDVDVLDHRAARVAVQAAHGVVVDALEVLDAQRLVARRRPHRADLHHVRADLDAERAQEGLGQRAAGHARGGLARAGALEHVAHVAQAVLPGADQVGVAGARQVDLGHLGLHRPRVHPLLPVGEVAVGDLQRDRPAERAPVAHAAGDLGAVALDLHAPAAPVAELAARHVAVDRLAVELEARGQALDDARQAGAVRLAGGDELQRHRAPKCMDGLRAARRRRAASAQTGRPGQGARGVGGRGGGGAVDRGARLALLGRADEHAAVGQPAVGRGALEGGAADPVGLAQHVGAGLGMALVAAAAAAAVLAPFLKTFTTSSWYWTAWPSTVRSKNSVSPSLTSIVWQLLGLGRQWPSPVAVASEESRKTAVLPSLSTPV